MELGIEKKTIRKYKPFLVPVIISVVFVVASLFATNFFWNRIQGIRSELSTDSTERDLLSDKLDILRQITLEVEDSSGLATTALPQKNPVVLVSSHLRQLALSNNVTIENLTSNERGRLETDPSDSVTIDFEIIGSYQNVYSYIERIISILPVVNISSIDVEEKNSVLTAEIKLTGFFAPFPESLPPITTKLDGFNDLERSTLLFLEDFDRPPILDNSGVFTEDIESGKVNPFE